MGGWRRLRICRFRKISSHDQYEDEYRNSVVAGGLHRHAGVSRSRATAVCQEQSYHLKTACPHPLSLAGPADERVYLRFQAGWASKYECEGLDLWDGSLCMFIPEIQYKEWVGKIWYGVSTEHRNHAELKYRLDYVRELGNWTAHAWYEHSFVFPGDKGIPRPGLKTTYHFSDRWFGGADLYWQYNNHTFRGYYAVFAGMHEEIADCVRVDAVVRYGYNGGYVGPVVHHGSNALDYNLSVTFRATGRLTVELFTNYSQALTVVKQKGLGDDFYYGVNLKYTF